MDAESMPRVDFDKEMFYGKWLTNGKNNKSSFRIYRKNGTFVNEKNLAGNYRIKKDSIIQITNSGEYSGRLVYQDSTTVKILWGNREAITYY